MQLTAMFFHPLLRIARVPPRLYVPVIVGVPILAVALGLALAVPGRERLVAVLGFVPEAQRLPLLMLVTFAGALLPASLAISTAFPHDARGRMLRRLPLSRRRLGLLTVAPALWTPMVAWLFCLPSFVGATGTARSIAPLAASFLLGVSASLVTAIAARQASTWPGLSALGPGPLTSLAAVGLAAAALTGLRTGAQSAWAPRLALLSTNEVSGLALLGGALLVLAGVAMASLSVWTKPSLDSGFGHLLVGSRVASANVTCAQLIRAIRSPRVREFAAVALTFLLCLGLVARRAAPEIRETLVANVQVVGLVLIVVAAWLAHLSVGLYARTRLARIAGARRASSLAVAGAVASGAALALAGLTLLLRAIGGGSLPIGMPVLVLLVVVLVGSLPVLRLWAPGSRRMPQDGGLIAAAALGFVAVSTLGHKLPAAPAILGAIALGALMLTSHFNRKEVRS